MWPFKKKRGYSTVTLSKTVVTMESTTELFASYNACESYEDLETSALAAINMMEGEEE